MPREPRRISLSMPGVILQPQAPPSERGVRRGGVVVAAVVVAFVRCRLGVVARRR